MADKSDVSLILPQGTIAHKDRLSAFIGVLSIAGGNTRQHPSSCRKKNNARKPAGCMVSTHTWRRRPKWVRLNSTTWTDVVGPCVSTSAVFTVCDGFICNSLLVFRPQENQGAQTALSVKDTQELIAVETDLLRPMPDKALSYQRHLYKIAADTQAALDKVVAAHYEANKHEMTNLVKSAAEPWDSGTADAILQAAIRATDLLFDGLRNAAKQMTQAAENSLKASADAVASASQPSDEQASQKAAQ